MGAEGRCHPRPAVTVEDWLVVGIQCALRKDLCAQHSSHYLGVITSDSSSHQHLLPDSQADAFRVLGCFVLVTVCNYLDISLTNSRSLSSSKAKFVAPHACCRIVFSPVIFKSYACTCKFTDAY